MRKDEKESDKEATDSEKESKDSESSGSVKQLRETQENDSREDLEDSGNVPKASEKPEDSNKAPGGSKKEHRKPEISTKEVNDPPKDLKLSEKGSKDWGNYNKKPVKNVQDSLEIVLRHVGEMGCYQKILFMFMFPFGLCFAFLYFVQMFIAVTPQRHWCTVPELSHLDMELRRNLSAPGAATGTWDRCNTFKVNWTEVLKTMTPPPPDTPTVPCRYGWDFEFSDIPYSNVVTERGWVCEESSNLPTSQAVFFVGAFIGGLLLGWLADYFGRLPALICANLLGGIGGIATIFTTSMWDYTLCRFIAGLAFDNVFMMPLILGPSYRKWVANLAIVFFGMGCLILPGLALLFKDWKMLLWVTSTPMLFVVFTPLVFPESARWCLSRGRVNEAVLILRKFARVNKTTIPDNVMDEFIAAANTVTETDESLLVLLRSVPLRLTMIFMMIVYMACSVIFDVLIRMSDAFGLDFFVTFTVTSSTEIPSVLLLATLLDIWGRRHLTAVPMSLTGLCIFAAIIAPIGVPQASMAVCARFFINMSFNAVVLWTTELLPTAVRASGSATMHMSGYVASILSPYIVYSEHYWHQLPLLILLVVALVSSAVSTLLPETKGQQMPQSIADGERMVKEHKMWRKSDILIWKKEKEKPIKIT